MRCSWPTPCDEDPSETVGMLPYCFEHSIDAEKRRETAIALRDSRRPSDSYRPSCDVLHRRILSRLAAEAAEVIRAA